MEWKQLDTGIRTADSTESELLRSAHRNLAQALESLGGFGNRLSRLSYSHHNSGRCHQQHDPKDMGTGTDSDRGPARSRPQVEDAGPRWPIHRFGARGVSDEAGGHMARREPGVGRQDI